MEQSNDSFLRAWLERELGELDEEIARLAFVCDVRLLDTGVLERILRHDASVCGASNPIGFKKLHDLLVMHFAVHEKVLDALGPEQTSQIMAHIVEHLKRRFGDVLEEPIRASSASNSR